MRIPLGDLDLVVEARIPGRRPPTVLWRAGPASRRPGPLPPAVPVTLPTDPNLVGVQLVAILKADQKFPFSIVGADEVGNPVALDGPAPTFAVDRPDVLVLTVGEDGFSGEVAATGALGTAVLSVSGTTASGLAYSGSAAVDVVAGDVAGVTISFGDPVEVTPDV